MEFSDRGMSHNGGIDEELSHFASADLPLRELNVMPITSMVEGCASEWIIHSQRCARVFLGPVPHRRTGEQDTAMGD